MSINFLQSKTDHSLFLHNQDGIHTVILIYMDDVIIAGNNLDRIQETKTQLDKSFSIKAFRWVSFELEDVHFGYRVMASVVSEILWVRWILKDSRLSLAAQQFCFATTRLSVILVTTLCFMNA